MPKGASDDQGVGPGTSSGPHLLPADQNRRVREATQNDPQDPGLHGRVLKGNTAPYFNRPRLHEAGTSP